MTVRQIVEILDSDGLTDVYSILADESPDVAEEVLDTLATPSRFSSLHAEDNNPYSLSGLVVCRPQRQEG